MRHVQPLLCDAVLPPTLNYVNVPFGTLYTAFIISVQHANDCVLSQMRKSIKKMYMKNVCVHNYENPNLYTAISAQHHEHSKRVIQSGFRQTLAKRTYSRKRSIYNQYFTSLQYGLPFFSVTYKVAHFKPASFSREHLFFFSLVINLRIVSSSPH